MLRNDFILGVKNAALKSRKTFSFHTRFGEDNTMNKLVVYAVSGTLVEYGLEWNKSVCSHRFRQLPTRRGSSRDRDANGEKILFFRFFLTSLPVNLFQ